MRKKTGNSSQLEDSAMAAAAATGKKKRKNSDTIHSVGGFAYPFSLSLYPEGPSDDGYDAVRG